MKIPYHNIDMQILLEQGKVASLRDSIMLNDNFKMQYSLNSVVGRRFLNYPIKLSSMVLILFCIEGSMEVRLNLKEYRLGKNDLLLARSGQIGEFNDMSNDVKFALVATTFDFYRPIFNSITDFTELQNALFNNPSCHISEKEMTENITVYTLLKEKMNSNDAIYKEESIQGYILTLIFNVYSSILAAARQEKKTQTPISRQQDLFNRFMEAVRENYTREHKIKFYANKLCVTPKYLSQIVYKVSGRYAGDFIDNFIILEAKALIRSRNYSILQISEMLHFTSQSFFGRFFKKATGYTPMQYQGLE
jgi:AraC-like DNA-binding protein